jgi:serine/threonine protein kinase
MGKMSEDVRIPKRVLVDDKTYNVITVHNGGMGRVWLLEKDFEGSFDPIYRPRVAVKTFDLIDDERAVESELNIWISLTHPSILPLKKIGRLNYRLAAIMPWLVASLDDLLESKGPLSEREVSNILLAMAEGLNYAWNTFRVLHLDLKPSNVLLEDRSGSGIRIADWGISRLATDRHIKVSAKEAKIPNSSFNRRTAYSAGTPLFMAPERFSGNWLLTPSVDIYSLGLMAIQLSTGFFPFSLEAVDPVEEILTGSCFRNACSLLSERSERFRRFCLECINPNPSLRPKSYHDLAGQLKSIRKG